MNSLAYINEVSGFNLINDKSVSTLFFLLALLVLRSVLLRRIQEITMAPEQKRRWILQLRNLALVLAGLGLLVIWGEEIRGVAISLVAFIAALVLALKELILCITGSILKAGSNSFRIGDRIEIQSNRGEVIDHNFLTTTLLELGPGSLSHQRTGRKIVLPNSLFLANPVINETFNHNYVLHLFSVPMKRTQDWAVAEATLMEAAQEASQDYIVEARELMEEIGRKHGLESSRADPRVNLQFPSADEVHLIVRLAVRAGERGVVEQKILRAFSSMLQSNS